MSALLDALREQRANDQGELEQLVATAEGESRGLTPEEDTRFGELSAEIPTLDARVAELEAMEARREAAATAARGQAQVTSEPTTYRRADPSVSFFRDMLAVAGKLGDGAVVDEARSRLASHAREARVWGEELHGRSARAAQRRLEGLGFGFEQRADNTTVGSGGSFVPPMYIVEDWIAKPRPGRVFSAAVHQEPLPDGTMSISMPRIDSGTTVAVQSSENTAVSNTDITDDFATSGVATIAGNADTSVQWVERSPGHIVDAVISDDLNRAYDAEVENQSLNGTGASKTLVGVCNVPGVGLVSLSSATDGSSLWAPIAEALSEVSQNVFDLESVGIFMHQRRWFWAAATLDTAHRPLFIPRGMGHFNALMEAVDGGPVAQGYVGDAVLGAPVYASAKVSTTDTTGGGTGQDQIVVADTDHTWLLEGGQQFKVFDQVLSGTLGIRFQLYGYVAQITRLPGSIAVIAGAGLGKPTGFGPSGS